MTEFRDQTYKQELREPEPSSHPDPRMQWTIKEPFLRIAKPTDQITLAKGGLH